MLHEKNGEKLRSLRKRAMLTQVEVVKLTGICVTTLYNLESGRRRPQTRTLQKLRNLYAVRIQMIKNQNAVFEENEDGGSISGQTVVWSGSPGLNTSRAPVKTANERPLQLPHGLSRIPGRP